MITLYSFNELPEGGPRGKARREIKHLSLAYGENPATDDEMISWIKEFEKSRYWAIQFTKRGELVKMYSQALAKITTT